MTTRVVEVALWMATAVCLVLGVAGLRTPRTVPRAATPAIRALPAPAPGRRDADSLLNAVERVADGNLFRPDRTRPDSTIPVQSVTGAPPPMAPPKPMLRLRGLVGGPPWDALIEGIPGHEGAVVARVGQTLGGITVRAVRRDTVIARGMDTTWKLTIGRSW